ncbi:G-type lectin S-receptor-like serine/threonine-protein kinase [Apostasia shenzhenica]|uniref:G-type lectin S-receptor-like serine/threonine-protein kinase n=1 Tax=Apostasia shenzhenica TaxID=1088818 RepID=A0A2H9ZYQ5_9ASPA|nr:G-type lectin S-receptor-like serine/threonine-protein kinase [Apostasia shenzhenica]
MYMAPEWAPDMTEPVTLKVDVFSFGILLLELISCRKFFDYEEEDRYRILSQKAYECLEEKKLEKLLPTCESEDGFAGEELEKMVKVGLLCLQEANWRPEMKEVVRMLEGKKTMEKPLKSVYGCSAA